MKKNSVLEEQNEKNKIVRWTETERTNQRKTRRTVLVAPLFLQKWRMGVLGFFSLWCSLYTSITHFINAFNWWKNYNKGTAWTEAAELRYSHGPIKFCILLGWTSHGFNCGLQFDNGGIHASKLQFCFQCARVWVPIWTSWFGIRGPPIHCFTLHNGVYAIIINICIVLYYNIYIFI